MTKSFPIPDDYPELLEQLKTRIRAAQVRAALSVNRELVLLYWHIGHEILARQQTAGWGAKVIDRLSADLRREFPEMKGFSPRNLKYMRAFAEAWPEQQIVQQAVAQIPWGHNVRILDKLNAAEERVWYVQQTLEHGWSRDVLLHHIDTDLYSRQGKAITNFPSTLPPQQSDLAQQLIKDPYSFDFLTLSTDAHEAELQRGLLRHLREFLVELGVGFAYVGSHVHLEVGGDGFYLDLLFYHLKLRCFVVIDLKTGPFQPEHAGKMNFYLAAVDEQLRHPDDQPSIGMILCREKNSLVVEYALRDMNKPIGVPEYAVTESLPAELAGDLPTIEELEAEFDRSLDHTNNDSPDQPQ
jgi:predicted nuclease of restriction endonuclease-like (RecB) superfamily